MATEIDLQSTAVLATGKLKRTGGEYSLVQLSAAHIDQILTLHNAALAGLADGERHYLHKKDRRFLEENFANGGAMLGIVHDGHLIAQSIVVHPTAAHPEVDIADVKITVPVDTLTILKGVVVDPVYRGNSLMGVMVEAWLALAKKQGRTHAISEVATENSFSWHVFLQKGLHIESVGFDKSDNTKTYNLHGHVPALSTLFNEKAKKSVAPRTDVARQKKLIAKGHKGVKFDAAGGTIEFHRLKQKKKPCL